MGYEVRKRNPAIVLMVHRKHQLSKGDIEFGNTDREVQRYAEDTAQELRALAAVPEVQGSIPRTYMAAINCL